MDKDTQHPACSNCGHPLAFETVAQFKEKSRVKIRLYPNEGECLGAGTVGKQISALEDVLIAAGDALGIPTICNIDGLSLHEDGSVEVAMLVARVLNAPLPLKDGEEG